MWTHGLKKTPQTAAPKVKSGPIMFGSILEARRFKTLYNLMFNTSRRIIKGKGYKIKII